MKFWPWNRAARFDTEYDNDARVKEIRAALQQEEATPTLVGSQSDRYMPVQGPTSCYECGGLFVTDKLAPATVITVFSPTKPVVVTERYFCRKCLPTANVEIALESRVGSGGNLDTVYFSTQEGYLQPFSFDNVEQTLIAADEFGLLYCGDCDNLINTKRKCRKCSTKRR